MATESTERSKTKPKTPPQPQQPDEPPTLPHDLPMFPENAPLDENGEPIVRP